MQFRENERVCLLCNLLSALVAFTLPIPVIYFASLQYGI
jgi:hypothetical protein